MKKIVGVLFAAVLTASAALAQTVAPLIQDATVQPGDSPLVAAAKRALAARQRAVGSDSAWVIDDSMVRHFRIADAAAPPPSLPPASAPTRAEVPSTFSSYDGTAARQQQERERAALQREQQLMAEENDQPYGGGVSEDHVVERMTQIPKQIEAIDRQAQQQPSPPPPPQ
jgi:hypothetical protein